MVLSWLLKEDVDVLMCNAVCSETMGSEGEGDARADEEAKEWAVDVRI